MANEAVPSQMRNTQIKKNSKLSRIACAFKQQKYLQLMVLPGLIWLAIFCYIPMAGLVAAFFEYNPFKGILHSPFVGLAHFKELFQDELFWNSVRNMFGLSLVKTLFSILMPIVFALMLNEIKNVTLKKIVQTASYLPHFISWVVVAGLFIMWLNTDGIVNHVLLSLGIIDTPMAYLNSPGGFWLWMAIIDTWKETGWWAIIYLAAIAAVPLEQYESALVDGAGRLRRIVSITLPSIKPTIMTVMILSIGSMIYGGLSGSNLQQSLLFGNALNYDNSMILETYIVNMGLSQGRFSYSIAAGLILSVLSFVLFSAANAVSRKLTKTSLY
jgi:putative aldouronate transport system permease protein